MKLLVISMLYTALASADTSPPALPPNDAIANQFNKTFVTCPDGPETLMEIRKHANVLGNPQIELNPTDKIIERGAAVLVSDLGALNPAIGAPTRIVGCFWFKREISGDRLTDTTRHCSMEIQLIRNLSQFKGCQASGPEPCTPPPCLPPRSGCWYRDIPTDAFGCPRGCGTMVCD